MLIDSHIHFWNYNKIKDAWITDDMKVLQQNFLPVNLEAIINENGIDGVVAVQANQSETETFFLNDLAKANPFIKAVIGWVDLRSEAAEERLNYFSQFPIIKGWRHIVQAEPEGFLLDNDFLRGINLLGKYGYTYDILIYPNQLKETLAFIQQFPHQKFVIDHCAKPLLKTKEIAEWKMWMNEIAAHPYVFCKVSGLLTEANWNNWTEADFTAYLDTVFGAFGTHRILFGSDWPVINLAGNYSGWKKIIENYLQSFSEEEQQKVFGGNAQAFYNC